jgi:hypothetical protein
MTIHNDSENSMTRKSAGVFPHFVGNAAFFDKVVAGVRGKRRQRPAEGIALARNLAIGGPNRFYARCERGRHSVSGNTLQLRYGLMRRYTNLSPFMVTVWANGSPVTCADLLLTLDRFMRRGYRTVIASVELTFDVEGIPLWRFARDLCTRAQVRAVYGRNGTETIYVGAPRSPWQARIYQKTRSIARVEFILRSAFLRALNIRRPQELCVLRTAKLWQKVGFCEVDQTYGHALPSRIRNVWSGCGFGLPPIMPASIVLRQLRNAQVDPATWVIPSPGEKLLRKMQRNLIW